MLQLRARTVPSLVDAAVTDSVVAEAGMTLSVLVRVVVVRAVVRAALARAVLVKVVLVKVVVVRAVDVVDDEAVVADVAEAVQVALLPASKSGNPRMSVRTCWFWDHVSKVVFQRGISRSVFSRLASGISDPM